MSRNSREPLLHPKTSVTKKRKSRIPSWLQFFIVGFACGLALQFVPGIYGLTARAQPSCDTSSWKASSISNPCLPLANPVLEREGYTVAYDGRAKTALWVQEKLTKNSITGNVNRSQFSFVQDPNIPTVVQADLSDYRGSGFDRGHLSPAADHRSSATAMRESFYLSNISPQEPQFNRGYWNRFEKYVRDLTDEYEEVCVVTGPLYLPHNESNGKRYVTYQVIGENDVAVPTHFFKIIAVGEGEQKQ